VPEIGVPGYSRAVYSTQTIAATAAASSDPASTGCPQGRLGVHLRYSLEPGEQQGAVVGNALFDLLAAVTESGSIAHAARALGCSYRYVWGALRKWEETLGEPLIRWEKGKKARPTEFAQKLVWAERRARLRMQPHIETLRSDLADVLAEARDTRSPLLTIRASHDLALPVLQHHAARAEQLNLSLSFQGSVEALEALNDGQCIVAGFHVPELRVAAPVFADALKPWLKPGTRMIACSRRMQGVMVRQEHAALVRGFPDLVRHRLRFVNRQPGSGTRMLIEHLMQEHSLAPAGLSGYAEHVENTHVSVALCVASGVVDAGIGIEAAALQFGLHFVPLLEESYFLACLEPNVAHPGVRRLREVLAGDRWREILAGLPGYRPAADPGALSLAGDVLPWWRAGRRKKPAAGSLVAPRIPADS
jgi:putative molybdopterin biosynthesis protein